MGKESGIYERSGIDGGSSIDEGPIYIRLESTRMKHINIEKYMYTLHIYVSLFLAYLSLSTCH